MKTSARNQFAGEIVQLTHGAANEASPLFKRHVNFSLAAGLVWTFYRSSRPAVLID